MGMFEDVAAFHRKFGLPTFPNARPRLLTPEEMNFRAGFLIEELSEFLEAYGMFTHARYLRDISFKDGDFLYRPSLEKAADALADLTYVTLGTAHMMGLPFNDIWGEVQRANMQKERASSDNDPRSSRKSSFDVVKPEGWRPPDHLPALRRWIE